MRFRIAFFVLLVLGASTVVHAQTRQAQTRQAQTRQAQTRQAPTLSLDGARRALAASEAESTRNGWSVCIVVVDAGGEPVAMARQDGVLPALCDVARAKARTAARYGRSSRAWSELLGRGNAGALMNLPDMFAVEGGVPVTVSAAVVGAVGVSGASAAQDGMVAQAGAVAVPR